MIVNQTALREKVYFKKLIRRDPGIHNNLQLQIIFAFVSTHNRSHRDIFKYRLQALTILNLT